MNRRRFLELLGTAALGSGIVYSFPSVIVPKNLSKSIDISDEMHISIITSPEYILKVVDDPEYGFGFFDYNKFRHFKVVGNTMFEIDNSVITKLEQEKAKTIHLLY